MDELWLYPQWPIVGGWSGPEPADARGMDAAIRDQVIANGVAFDFKQWGGVKKYGTGRILGWPDMGWASKRKTMKPTGTIREPIVASCVGMVGRAYPRISRQELDKPPR